MLVCVNAPGLKIRKRDAVGGGSVNAADQLGLRIALEGHQLVAGLARQLRGALLDRFESVAP